MKMMVVDDNKQVREGISLGIEWKEYGISEVRAYEDGAEAENDLKGFQPDLIIADIRMPNMNGLELLEKVRRNYSEKQCRYILLSAYSEFTYAQKALKLGADDYILKPVKPGQLIELVMENMKKLLEAQKEYKSYNDVYEKSFLHSVLNGEELKEPEKLKEFLNRRFGMDIREDRLVVGKVKIESKDPKARKKPISAETMQKIEEILKKEGYAAKTGELGQFLIIRQGKRSELQNLTRTIEIKREYEQWNQKFPNIQMTVGISRGYESAKLGEAWIEAGKALEQSYYQEVGSCVLYIELLKKMSSEIPESWKKHCMEQLAEAVKKRNRTDAEEILNEVYRKSRENGYPPEKVRNFLNQMYRYQLRYAGIRESGELEQEILYDGFYMKEILEKLESYLFEFAKKEQEKEREAYSATIRNICGYVEEHFMDPLTVEFLAEKFNRTPNYISAKFKREVGKSFTDYLMEVRVRKAFFMLQYTDIPINEVAIKSGFGSYAYFSRIFRKCTGKNAGSIREGK